VTLVDTTVWIDVFRGTGTAQVQELDVALLHNDRDFDAIASLGELKIVETEKPTTPRPLRRVPRRKRR